MTQFQPASRQGSLKSLLCQWLWRDDGIWRERPWLLESASELRERQSKLSGGQLIDPDEFASLFMAEIYDDFSITAPVKPTDTILAATKIRYRQLLTRRPR